MKIELLKDMKLALNGVDITDHDKGDIVELKDAVAQSLVSNKLAKIEGEKKSPAKSRKKTNDKPAETR